MSEATTTFLEEVKELLDARNELRVALAIGTVMDRHGSGAVGISNHYQGNDSSREEAKSPAVESPDAGAKQTPRDPHKGVNTESKPPKAKGRGKRLSSKDPSQLHLLDAGESEAHVGEEQVSRDPPKGVAVVEVQPKAKGRGRRSSTRKVQQHDDDQQLIDYGQARHLISASIAEAMKPRGGGADQVLPRSLYEASSSPLPSSPRSPSLASSDWVTKSTFKVNRRSDL